MEIWFDFYYIILFGIQFKFCQAIDKIKVHSEDRWYTDNQSEMNVSGCFFPLLIYAALDFQLTRRQIRLPCT